MSSQKVVVSLKFDPEKLERIEEFRFQYRFPTRTAAIMWLLEWALSQRPRPPAAERG